MQTMQVFKLEVTLDGLGPDLDAQGSELVRILRREANRIESNRTTTTTLFSGGFPVGFTKLVTRRER